MVGVFALRCQVLRNQCGRVGRATCSFSQCLLPLRYQSITQNFSRQECHLQGTKSVCLVAPPPHNYFHNETYHHQPQNTSKSASLSFTTGHCFPTFPCRSVVDPAAPALLSSFKPFPSRWRSPVLVPRSVHSAGPTCGKQCIGMSLAAQTDR